MATIGDIHNFLRIDDSLTTSGQPNEDQFRVLAAEGYGLVVNLALHDDPRYSLADEAGLVQGLGMAYVHIPVQFDHPTQADLKAFFCAMDRNAGRKIHVHCAANMRVTAFLGLYQVIRQGQPTDQAFAPMRAIWEPNQVWAAFIAGMLDRAAGL